MAWFAHCHVLLKSERKERERKREREREREPLVVFLNPVIYPAKIYVSCPTHCTNFQEWTWKLFTSMRNDACDNIKALVLFFAPIFNIALLSRFCNYCIIFLQPRRNTGLAWREKFKIWVAGWESQSMPNLQEWASQSMPNLQVWASQGKSNMQDERVSKW